MREWVSVVVEVIGKGLEYVVVFNAEAVAVYELVVGFEFGDLVEESAVDEGVEGGAEGLGNGFVGCCASLADLFVDELVFALAFFAAVVDDEAAGAAFQHFVLGLLGFA